MRDEPGSPSAADARLAALLGAYRLKDEPRRGWVMRGIDRPESVAAHSWGTALLCLVFAEEAGVDVGRAVAIATAHDVAEAELGDLPARAHPDDREAEAGEKARLEAAALERLLGVELAGVRALWREYERSVSPEALFVRDMNLLDMALQAVVYEEEARYDPRRPLPSRGGHRHLDEFFASAEARVQGVLARRWLGRVRERYERARAHRT